MGADVLDKQARLSSPATSPSIEMIGAITGTKSCCRAVYAPTYCSSQLRQEETNCNRSSSDSSPNKCDFRIGNTDGLYLTFHMKYYVNYSQQSYPHSSHFHLVSNLMLVFDSMSTPIPSWKPHAAEAKKDTEVGNR